MSPITNQDASAGDAERRAILIVDDEPFVRDVLVRWLTAERYHCVAVGDAEAAWRELQARNFDLVTSDINMPGVSGLQLLPRIIGAFPDMAVLMLTGCGEASTAVQALTQGAYGYLTKPVQQDELIWQVRLGLERADLRKERRRHTERLEQRVREQTRTIREAHEETIHRLITASSFRDEETGAHIRRTGLFSEALARTIGWSTSESDLLRMAAPMHDVGKIGIPDAVLRKPGRLTREEFDVMKRHTTIGARMLDGSSSPVLQLARDVALSHHERWDGTGYPHGSGGESVSEAARIVAVVDVYDALTHHRVYRPALPEADVLQIMHDGSGTHFDPALLAVFFTILDEIRAIAEAHPDGCEDPGAGPEGHMPQSAAPVASAASTV